MSKQKYPNNDIKEYYRLGLLKDYNFQTNDGGVYLSDYSGEEISGTILFFDVILNGKKKIIKLSQKDYLEITGKKSF